MTGQEGTDGHFLGGLVPPLMEGEKDRGVEEEEQTVNFRITGNTWKMEHAAEELSFPFCSKERQDLKMIARSLRHRTAMNMKLT